MAKLGRWGTDAGDKTNNIEAIKFRLVTDSGIINKITLNKEEVTLEKGSKDSLSVSFRPTNTTMDKTIHWSSSNDKIVTVDQNGNIHAVGAGNATIAAETVNGVKATCDVKQSFLLVLLNWTKQMKQLKKERQFN